MDWHKIHTVHTIYTYARTRIYVYTHVLIPKPTRIPGPYLHLHIYIYTVCIYTSTYIIHGASVHTYTHTYIHAHMQAYIHMHVHMQMQICMDTCCRVRVPNMGMHTRTFTQIGLSRFMTMGIWVYIYIYNHCYICIYLCMSSLTIFTDCFVYICVRSYNARAPGDTSKDAADPASLGLRRLTRTAGSCGSPALHDAGLRAFWL